MSRPVRIAVDGTTNLDPQLRERLGIAVIPIHVANIPPEIETRLAERDYEPFYEYLRGQHPAEAQPGTRAGSVWEVRQVFEDLVRHHDCDIICLVASGRLSAIYDNASQAACELADKYPNRIVVLAEQAFLTLSVLGQAAAEYAATGRGFEEVLAFVEDKRDRGFMTGSIVGLGSLRRSGRVRISPVVLAIGRPFLRLLGLVPTFILEEGRPRTLSLIRRRRLARFALKSASDRVGFREPVVARVGYSGSGVRAEAEQLRDAVADSPGLRLRGPVEVERVSPAVGVHAGARLVAFAALGLGYDALSTPVLLRMLAEAQEELRRFRRTVNVINVFPVRDGDTGSNLLSPLLGVEQGIAAELPFPEAMELVAARVARRGGGYSGGALAAYLLGFSSCVRAHETGAELRPATLVRALTEATDRTYAYFGADAKEGTILSVMRACDGAAAAAFRSRPTLRNVLVSAYLAASEELLYPRVQEVEILRREQLADAGGLGFVLLLWSALRTLGLTRSGRLRERQRLVLQEVRRHGELGRRLVYRRQPPELRGYCVEACVRGEVAEELRAEFMALDNRIPEPKMTFNVVDGATHFHFHVSPGLEDEVLRIAARYGYVEEPRPPTRLDKRRREILGVRIVGALSRVKRIPRYIAAFFINWVAYALLFPVMQYRAYRRLKALEAEIEHLALSRLGLSALAEESDKALLVLDSEGNVKFANTRAGSPVTGSDGRLEDYLPGAVARALRQRLPEAVGGREPVDLRAGDAAFVVRNLTEGGRNSGFLVSYTGLSPDRAASGLTAGQATLH